MKEFCIIGLGNFGYTLATQLAAAGNIVVVVDKDAEKIRRIKALVSYALCADARFVSNFSDYITPATDEIFVCMGEMLEDTVLTLVALLQMKIKKITVKVTQDRHADIVKKLGITSIIIPEREYAIELAEKYRATDVVDYPARVV